MLFSISPVLHVVSDLAVLGFDTVRPLAQPQGALRATLDPTFVGIYLQNIRTISAINRQRILIVSSDGSALALEA